MSFLENATISSEPIKTAWFGIIAGMPGCGKTNLASFAPDPFFIANESGVEHLSGTRNIGLFVDSKGRLLMPEKENDFWEALKHLITIKHNYKTIVIDSAKPLETMFIANVIESEPTIMVKSADGKSKVPKKVESIDDYLFGAGYGKVEAKWNRFLVAVNAFKKRGINVLLLCHTHEKRRQDFDGDEYKRTELNLLSWGNYDFGQKLFAASRFTYVMRSESKTKEIKSFIGKKNIADNNSTPTIMVYTRNNNAFDAKVWTRDINNVPDMYPINIYDDETSKVIFSDLEL